MGALRLNAVWLHYFRERGLTHSLCDGHSLTAPISGFWAVAFSLSKVRNVTRLKYRHVLDNALKTKPRSLDPEQARKSVPHTHPAYSNQSIGI